MIGAYQHLIGSYANKLDDKTKLGWRREKANMRFGVGRQFNFDDFIKFSLNFHQNIKTFDEFLLACKFIVAWRNREEQRMASAET